MSSPVRTIHLLGSPFDIPALPDLSALRDQTRARARIVETGQAEQAPVRRVRLKAAALGLGAPRLLVEVVEARPAPLDEESRLDHLDALLASHGAVMTGLEAAAEAYAGFFRTLTWGVHRATHEALARIGRAEADRRALALNAKALDDAALGARAERLGDRLRRSARALAAAALLILQKLDLYKAALDELVGDQRRQREILGGFRARLDLHRRLLRLEGEVSDIEAEIGEMGRAAVGFGDYMRDYLAPLQAMIDAAGGVDERLCEAVFEIESLVADLLHERASLLGGSEAELLEVLVSAHLKRDRLEALLVHLDRVDPEGDALDLDTATEVGGLAGVLDNIEGLLHLKLGPMLDGAGPAPRAPSLVVAVGARRGRFGGALPPMDASGDPPPDLRGLSLRGQQLARACLGEAGLNGVDLTGADLSGANLQGAKLCGARLDGANLQGAWLQGADLSGASAQGVVLHGARYDALTRWPGGLDGHKQGALGPGAVMADANLRGVDLRGADLRGADLKRVCLQGADLRGADLRGADLRGADLGGADLRGADLTGAQLMEQGVSGQTRLGLGLKGALYDRRTRWPEGFRPRLGGAEPVV